MTNGEVAAYYATLPPNEQAKMSVFFQDGGMVTAPVVITDPVMVRNVDDHFYGGSPVSESVLEMRRDLIGKPGVNVDPHRSSHFGSID